MSPLFISLLTLAIASPLFYIIRPDRWRHCGWFAALVPAAIAAWLCLQLSTIAAGNEIRATLPWSPHLGLEVALRVDGLALFFSLIITVIGSAIALYTGYYFEGETRLGYFYSLLFLFMASMLGLVWADNLLALFAFWEGTSITSYLLIAFKDSDPAAQAGARRAFLVTGMGGLAMLMGIVLLGTAAGTYTISELLVTPNLTASAVAPAAIVLILLGAFTKSAQFPFHFWLPGAMSAPTPASAYLHSATMVKAGVYLLARLHPALSGSPIWFWGLLLVGDFTMLLGAILSVRQSDIKALLAYATVSQLGLFVMLLAFRSEEAYTAVVVGILAHALYKAPLFLLAGIVDHATGTRDLRRLANLRSALPLCTVIALLAVLSMAGIPPLLGFVAKELLLGSQLALTSTMAVAGWAGVISSVLAAAFTVAASMVMIWEAFLRPTAEDNPAGVHHPPALPFVLPALIIVLFGVALPFLLPQAEELLIAPAVSAIATGDIEPHLALWHGLNLPLLLSVIAVLLGVALFALRGPLRASLIAWTAGIDGAQLWEAAMAGLYGVANWVTRNVQGITLLQQARGILISAVVVMVVALAAVRWPQDFPIDWTVQPHVPEVIMATLAIFAALITVVAGTRLSAIISLGVVGIAITLFFVFHSAPDLALTQLLVDILTVVLLVLVFYRIPPSEYSNITPKKHSIRNNILSIFVGILAFFFVLFTVSQPFFPVIGDYFLYNAVPLGHGGNVVNVMLVDFRAFDTYGEITVLGIAAVAGYAVLRAGLLRFNPLPLEKALDPERDQVLEKRGS